MLETLKWDIAIAPLEENAFNQCKSDLKFLDYSALGFAGIYSRVAPYERTVRHLETGYLVDNTPESWLEALNVLLDDDKLRRGIAAEAQRYVFEKRTLKQCARIWQEVIFSFLA
jgi:glycosyltransferase involved in cell wall biosynthesis